ncbi:hypothetical protein CCR75_007994 [Bremia lactucae]|uniref:Nucleoplasmin-like domain-containing protein n=1 Tax=Bremia lactucae TaxID=4779 RepID=A0A976NZP8_BRELC|nr:hypothetical protein CCR75_007994 [Bremia lactucae]
MVSFWGCTVTETKTASVNVPEGFVLNVVNATCDATAADAQVTIGLETNQLDGKAWKGAVAHLGAKQPLQVKLDLVFAQSVKFYLAKGLGSVNLSGYFQPGPSAGLPKANTTTQPSNAPKKSKKRANVEVKEPLKSVKEAPVSTGEVVKKKGKASASKSKEKKTQNASTSSVSAAPNANEKKTPENSSPAVSTAPKKKRKKNKVNSQAA